MLGTPSLIHTQPLENDMSGCETTMVKEVVRLPEFPAERVTCDPGLRVTWRPPRSDVYWPAST